MVRESVFVCSCRLNETVRAAHVRAWDEDEAAEIFLQELNDEGLFDVSDLRVSAVPIERHGASEQSSRASVAEVDAAEGSAA